MPFPITTVFLFAALCFAILGAPVGCGIALGVALVLELGIFVLGGFGD